MFEWIKYTYFKAKLMEDWKLLISNYRFKKKYQMYS